MKKRLLSLALALFLVLSFVPAVIHAVADKFMPVTGWDMMAKLGLGITFANSTEARTWPWIEGWVLEDPMDSEICWGQPRIEQWQLQSAAMKGFDSYRLCVSWTPHMDKDYKIDPAWMDRIQQIADWALDAGMNILINTHHEEELYYLIRDGEYEKAKRHLTAIWSQVAERFKGYDERVLFEILNEPNLQKHYGSANSGDKWIWDDDGSVNQPLCNIVNKLNKDALDVIRKSGGNNAHRVVVLGVPGGMVAALPFMEVPDNDPYIMLGTFGCSIGTNERETAIVQAVLNKGIAFVDKEDYVGNISEKDHFGVLAKMGVPAFMFVGSADFLDRETGEWINKPMIDAVFTAYGKPLGPDFVYTPPLPALPCELEGVFNDKEYTFWQPPERELAAAEKLVIEVSGKINWYKFSRDNPTSWTEWEIGDKRITEENGKIIFDMRGLEGKRLGFLTWNDGDAAKIKRAYIDTWEGTPMPQPLNAIPSPSKVTLNNSPETSFDAYNINGNNYFKLRDLAQFLNGSDKQFAVGYDDATKAVTLTSGQPYVSVGNEMNLGDGQMKTPATSANIFYLDGKRVEITAYNIGGNNYLKLRDVMELLDVFVGYDNATRTITLDTGKGYVAP